MTSGTAVLAAKHTPSTAFLTLIRMSGTRLSNFVQTVSALFPLQRFLAVKQVPDHRARGQMSQRLIEGVPVLFQHPSDYTT